MSTPSPDPQKGDLAYQSSEASEHGLLSHVHTCTCSEKPQEAPKTDLGHAHAIPKTTLHHVIGLSHTSNMLSHAHVHATPKMTCTCHNIQEDCENLGEDEIRQNRKLEEDRIEVSPMPPALPPRPPPRPRYDGSLNSRYRPRIGKTIF